MTFADEKRRRWLEVIDLHQPILGQLHVLLHRDGLYHEWIHRPTRGEPTFFRSALAEQLTKVTWWTVPLIWLPVAGVCLCKSMAQIQSYSICSVLVLVGIFVWQMIEYGLHRYLFHWNAQTLPGIYLHFLFHGCHHKFPYDMHRLVFPPFPAAMIALCIFGALTLVLPTIPQALSVFSGILLGYVWYDCCHYAIHAGWMKNSISRNHIRHHYRDDTKNYGITSPLFDYILGSYHRIVQDAPCRQTSRTSNMTFMQIK